MNSTGMSGPKAMSLFLRTSDTDERLYRTIRRASESVAIAVEPVNVPYAQYSGVANFSMKPLSG